MGVLFFARHVREIAVLPSNFPARWCVSLKMKIIWCEQIRFLFVGGKISLMIN